MKKNTIITLTALLLTACIFVVIAYSSKVENLGATGEGDWKRLTTGSDQAVTYGKAILHSIVIGTANDEVYVGDVLYSATASSSDNAVFDITATTPMVFPVETIFTFGIMANVTSTNGVVFITSPQ